MGQQESESFSECKTLAESGGDAAAQARLGWRYAKGEDCHADPVEAVSWFRKAARQENPSAAYGLGCAYLYGRGIGNDFDEGLKWISQAAENGDQDAQFELGELYRTGMKVAEKGPVLLAKDGTAAFRWIRESATGGKVEAQWSLANLYSSGEGVSADMNEAIRWWRAAADSGHTPSTFSGDDISG